MDDELMSFLNEQAVYLEKQRIKAIKLNKGYKIVKPIKKFLGVVFVISLLINAIIPIIIAITICIGIGLFFLDLVKNPKKAFESKLKNNVIPEILKNINDTFRYSSTGYNEQTLKESEFLTKGYFAKKTRIVGEDHVKGSIKNIDVEFFEIKFFNETTSYSKTAAGCLLSGLISGDGDNEIVMVKDENLFFSGFFMYADFHKEFKGKVFMIPKDKEKMMDRMRNESGPKKLTSLNVENPYINENYNIYASEGQTGYYVLSQNLIDKIHKLSKKEDALPIISFIDGKMYFVIPWNKDFFKVSITSKIENGNYFAPFVNEIISFETIVKDLNLDTRIWSKE